MFAWSSYALALNEGDGPDAERFLLERFNNGGFEESVEGSLIFWYWSVELRLVFEGFDGQ